MEEEYINIDESGEGSSSRKLAGLISGRYFMAVVILFVALISFFLGRISGLDEKREAVRVLNVATAGEVKGTSISTAVPTLQESSASRDQPSTGTTASQGSVVASKNGTKYHYPWCAGAKQISEKNKITFGSIEEARAAGYTPASNCKGLR